MSIENGWWSAQTRIGTYSLQKQVRQANKDASPFLCCFVVVVAVVVVVMVVAVAVDWMHMNIV